MNNYRHGDIFLKQVNKTDGKEIEHNGSYVLAEGETTGHKHLLTAPQMIVKQAENGKFYLDLKEKGTLTHEEHKTLTIEPGTYEVVREREYDHFSHSIRRVID